MDPAPSPDVPSVPKPSLLLPGVVGLFAGLIVSVGAIAGWNAFRMTRQDRVHRAFSELENSLTLFEMEYNRYPRVRPVGETSLETDEKTMRILLGREEGASRENSRNIAFFETGDEDEADPAVTAFLDPWGSPYRIRIDTDGNGSVQNPELPATLLDLRVIIWSAGPDRDFETWEDNPRTW